ncbi:CpaF family protein [Streptomyces sp. NRRL S-241]|uniref:CpaF family protein n=1 Tax=Streptomyces sp. NRRL S-241 TaxID=1463896 RepID=UPI0004BF2A52|nr:CpaF/VirB11 family protein [Streptomyces sp. NRRL S-241]
MSDTQQRPDGPTAHGPADIAGLLTGRIGTTRIPQPATAPAPAPALPAPARPAAAASPGAVPKLAGLPGQLPVAWDVIEALQAEVSAELSAHDPSRLLEEDDRRAQARSMVTKAVAHWSAKYSHGNSALSPAEEHAIGAAVFDAMFRGGRLQGLLDEEGVEDVMVDGLRAHIEYYDRPRRSIDRVADSHAELITWVNRMAGLSGHGERALTQATPNVGFRMPDGSRVTASLLTTRPSVVIRKHRIRQHGIDELLQWGSINPLLRAFLLACVQAKLNILVVGDMGAGKTSLLRALGREIPPGERIATLESDRELYLDEPGPPDKPGPLTFAFEARQSNGEVRAGSASGEVTIGDMFPTALRYNVNRVIVGEVRSTEVLPMLQAMSAGGSGSMCTLHVRRPHAIISRLVQLCTEAGMQTEAANHLIASAIDVVVYLTYLDETAIGGRKHRFVSHIYEVHDVVGEGGRPTTSELFAPHGDEPRAVYRNMPSYIDVLERTGTFDRHWLTQNPEGAWGPPMKLVKRR